MGYLKVKNEDGCRSSVYIIPIEKIEAIELERTEYGNHFLIFHLNSMEIKVKVKGESKGLLERLAMAMHVNRNYGEVVDLETILKEVKGDDSRST